MAYFTGEDFSDGAQVTSTKLDAITINLRLGPDSVDGSTITVASGVLSLGIVGAANMGANSVTTNSILDANVTAAKLATDSVETAKIKDAAVTSAKLAADSVSWSKVLAADKAIQADMQSETADHFVSPAVLKYFPGVSKAGGIVTMATGAISGGHNITGTASGSVTSRVITLAVTMANTNYRVQFSQEDTATTANAPSIINKTTTTFTINGGGTAYGFDIFGTLA